METLISLLRNLFPYQGYKFSVLENKKRIILGMKSRRKTGTCPVCKKRCSDIESEYQRTIRDLDLSGKWCFLRFWQKKIHCSCGFRGYESLEFVSKLRRVTKRFETYVVSLCEKMSLKDVSLVTNLDWKTIKNIDRDYIRSMLPEISKLTIIRIAIDEIAIMKGHKYFTIIRDYDTGIAIRILFGRGYEETVGALDSLGEDKLKKIEYASMDMWDPYIKAIKEKCPNAKLVFNKFHVVKKVNEALDKVRKNEFKHAEPEERIKMKHKRFIMLKRGHNLRHDQKVTLQTLMETNNTLYKAYLLKEQILSIFDDKKCTFEQINTKIQSWFENILTNQTE